MRKTGLRPAEKYARQRKKRSVWKRTVAALTCVVVFITTYMLILPAITAEKQTYCGNEEHEHTLQCFSNPDADVETQEDWEKSLSDISLTGKPNDDLVAIAKSQVGYQESSKNYHVTEDGQQKGYTRYGAWYGDTYGDWDAMFVAFCLNYTGIQEYPADADCSVWAQQLQTEPYDYFRTKDAYQPQSGDLIFFDTDEDGTADHMGIVDSIDSENDKMQTIEGDVSDRVEYRTYSSDDATILGYGIIPADAEEDSNASVMKNGQGGGHGGGGGGSGGTSGEETSAVSGLPAVEAPDYIGTIPTANSTEWQITREEYTGREQSNKQPFDADKDGNPDLYLQKNVVPTTTENEFLVYLSMDKKMTMKKFFDQSRCGVTTSNGYKPGDIVSSIKGNSTELGAYGETGTNKYLVKLHVYQRQGGKEVYNYYSERWGSTPNCSNGSAYIALAGTKQYLILRNKVDLKEDGNGQGDILEATIYLDEVQIAFSTQDVDFEKVTDVMGDRIEYLGVEHVDGTATCDNNTLTWIPKDNESVVSKVETNGSKVTGWENNICQLVYRVRLRVNQKDTQDDKQEDEFKSCADTINSKSDSIAKGESYPVNQSATLQYRMKSISGTTSSEGELLTATYPVPEVRGLLYEVSFDKQSDSGESLGGAVFALSQGDKVIETLTTVKNQTSKFEKNLPCGTYTLKETSPPTGYTAPDNTSWTMNLNYTNNKSAFAQSSLNSNMMRYTENDADGKWVIVNNKNPYTYQVEILKTDENGTALQNASFSITNPEGTAEPLTGTTDENGNIAFTAAFQPNFEYTLTETAAPDGYNLLPAEIRFKVAESDTGGWTAQLENSEQLKNLVNLDLSETDDGKGKLTIQIKNQESYELPETGGHGTILFTLCGLALITGALMYKYHEIRKRRAE